ncbi:MAG TPA: cytochrome c, partial [Myxococcaceae bacterium]|nr:cytochrome c [Myxococcaceae bacterium]
MRLGSPAELRRSGIALGLLLCAGAFTAWADAPQGTGDSKPWHRLVGILQYLEADYPAAVESKSEFELTEQRAFMDEALVAARELGPKAAPFVERIRALQPVVGRGEDAEGVSQACGNLARELIQVAGLDRSPRRAPDLRRGAELYQAACAACHGADGSARVVIATTMKPPPASFLDAEVMEALTPYKAYNTTTFGVPETGMPAFPSLSDEERWAVAFYVQSIRQPACQGATPRVPLQELSVSTDPQLVKAHGPEALPCLRRLDGQREEGGLARADSGVREALRLAGQGSAVAARQALLDAYLEGLEPEEPRLRGRDPALAQKLEEGFLSL